MPRKRRNFSSGEKIAILREHLLEKVPVSDLCDKHNIHPTLFYRWQKTFFEKGDLTFESENKRHEKTLERQIGDLKDKLAVKDEIIAELLGEHMAFKKKHGGL